MSPTPPDLTSLLAGYSELLEAMRRLATLSERLLERAAGHKPLTARKKLTPVTSWTWHAKASNSLEIMVTVMRQGMRVM